MIGIPYARSTTRRVATFDGDTVELPAKECPACGEILLPTEATVNETAAREGFGDLSKAAGLTYAHHYEETHS